MVDAFENFLRKSTMVAVKILFGMAYIILMREILNWFHRFANIGQCNGTEMITVFVASYFVGSIIVAIGNKLTNKKLGGE